MQNIFVGMLFTTLNFHLTFNGYKIGLIPDFIGYILLLKGVDEVARESQSFMKIRTYIQGMAVYSTITYILDLLGMTYIIPDIASILLGIIYTIISLYITYHIIRGIGDIERNHGWYLQSQALYSIWIGMAVLSLLQYLALFIPVIAFGMVIINVMVSIYFLVELNRSKNLYYDSCMKK